MKNFFKSKRIHSSKIKIAYYDELQKKRKQMLLRRSLTQNIQALKNWVVRLPL